MTRRLLSLLFALSLTAAFTACAESRRENLNEAAEERQDAQEQMREGDVEEAREQMGEAREEMREAGAAGDTIMMSDTMPL